MHTTLELGTYYIVNRVQSIAGERLAVTYHGEGEPLTVEVLSSDNDCQKWVVWDTDNRELQAISPACATDVTITWGDIGRNTGRSMVTATTEVNGWPIRPTDTGHAIFSECLSQAWGLRSARAGCEVTVSNNDYHSTEQRWVFERA